MLHSEADLRDMFATLRAGLEANEHVVVVPDQAPETLRGAAGFLEPPQPGMLGGWRIVICRVHPDVPGDAATELITLAHEAGHNRSRLREERPEGYFDVLKRLHAHRPLSVDEWQQVRNEEIRAWCYGVGYLRAICFSDWGAFDRIRGDALRTYGVPEDVITG